jgi:hypothetical protein
MLTALCPWCKIEHEFKQHPEKANRRQVVCPKNGRSFMEISDYGEIVVDSPFVDEEEE